MSLSVHALAGHARALLRETSSDMSNPQGDDFSSMVDDLSGAQPGSTEPGGTQPGNQGGGSVGNIEPFLLTDAQLALLTSDDPSDGRVDTGNGDDPSSDLTGASPTTEPGLIEPGVLDDIALNEPAATSDYQPSSGGDATVGVIADPPDPNLAATDGFQPSSQGDSTLEESAIIAMREASMRFESFDALLRLTQSI